VHPGFKLIRDLLALVPGAKRAGLALLAVQTEPQSKATPASRLSKAVLENYRCPAEFLPWQLSGTLSFNQGYFRFGENVTCYGHSCYGALEAQAGAELYDALADVAVRNGTVELPFDPTEILDNLRLERYNGGIRLRLQRLLKKGYYQLRPLMGVAFRSQLQRFRARNWEGLPFPKWPVDTTIEDICERLLLLSIEAREEEKIPFIWFWPNGAAACVTMTHDVETEEGRAFVPRLMDLNDHYGIKSSFQLVPEGRYQVSEDFLQDIRSRGFELAVHDLNHDGRLYDDREEFLRRVKRINGYGAEWRANGFRAGVLYRNPDWFHELNFLYEMSMPNVGHLDPQAGGCCTVMPYFIGNKLEIPVTMVQDYMLFHLLKERSIDLWKTQSRLIQRKHGLMSFIVHPDYVIERDTRTVYEDLLAYLRDLRGESQVWTALPGEIDAWWRLRSKMRLQPQGGSWRIEGEGADRAVLAYARKVDGELVYECDQRLARAGNS
jgi:peptidoglycan/xylan/chitin deacetylase (PgdA/CDA1 family)